MCNFNGYRYFRYVSYFICLLAFELRAQESPIQDLLIEYFGAFRQNREEEAPTRRASLVERSDPSRNKVSVAVDLIGDLNHQWDFRNRTSSIGGKLFESYSISPSVIPYEIKLRERVEELGFDFDELIKIGILFDLSLLPDQTDFSEEQKGFIKKLEPFAVEVFIGADGEGLLRRFKPRGQIFLLSQFGSLRTQLLEHSPDFLVGRSSDFILDHLNHLLEKILKNFNSESLIEFNSWIYFYSLESLVHDAPIAAHTGRPSNFSKAISDKSFLKLLEKLVIDLSNKGDAELLRSILPTLDKLSEENRAIRKISNGLRPRLTGSLAIVDVKEEGSLSISSLGSEDPTPSSTGPEPSFFKRCASRVKELFRRR